LTHRAPDHPTESTEGTGGRSGARCPARGSGRYRGGV